MKRSLCLLLMSGLLLVAANPVWAMNQTVEGPGGVDYHVNADERQEHQADEGPGPFRRLYNRWITTWNEGDFTVIVPFYAWHNRLMYDWDHWHKYNEHPWGGGFGLSMHDEDGDTHIIYTMAFLDSWDKVQPGIGYAYLKNWYLDEDHDYRVGVGYTMGITARDNYNYIPFPAALPVVGVGYKSFSVEAAYVPGTFNNGNVLFAWARWSFD